ncbi:low molecular weight protein-tyrosine-phosphatase [Parvularcula dongshanensis]|uniref:protein-tyrosine-phosphatase n=1 Tax=Parvularcula dongshanensis TaxID=1173995 RepID=A0A840I225_9PROT|nr:low molecular weight protein-tyrosine-phosphatase [Parvularcula dongshanensis]MBB4658333.1 protein-tyrosine phosphatase [Parvularcula dongshanensis]
MTRVLLVCLGNICRSPAAEAILRDKSEKAGIDLEIDSAGTGRWHVGKPPDARMIKAAGKRGYDLKTLRGRQVDTGDFYTFDLILPMDTSNMADLEDLAPPDATAKLRPFLSYGVGGDVPDPYHGGPSGFETVLDMIEHASDGLVKALASRRA